MQRGFELSWLNISTSALYIAIELRSENDARLARESFVRTCHWKNSAASHLVQRLLVLQYRGAAN